MKNKIIRKKSFGKNKRNLKRSSEKGDIVLSELVKIVLAVICIALLIILADKLYGLFFTKTAAQQAKESLKVFSDELNKVTSGQESQGQVFIESPAGWEVDVWPNSYSGSTLTLKPDTCKAQYCLCICEPSISSQNNIMYVMVNGVKNVVLGKNAIQDDVKNCELSGSCQDISMKIVTLDQYNMINPLEIKGPTAFNISMSSGVISVNQEK